MTLPANPDTWPDEFRYRLQERIAIMLDSDVKDARAKAEADVRRMAEAE